MSDQTACKNSGTVDYRSKSCHLNIHSEVFYAEEADKMSDYALSSCFHTHNPVSSTSFYPNHRAYIHDTGIPDNPDRKAPVPALLSLRHP